MNRRQRMKNRETARRLRQWVTAPTLSIGCVDPGAPEGDLSSVAWVQAGRVLNFHFTARRADPFVPLAADRRFSAVGRINEGVSP